MLIAVGMYLPFYTTSAIFIGGVIRWVADRIAQKKFGQDKKVLEQVENRGLLVASGLVAGEALVGIILAAIVATNTKLFCAGELYQSFVKGKADVKCLAESPSWFQVRALGVLVIIGLAIYMVTMSLKGIQATPPAPPTGGTGDAAPGEAAPPPAA
jgi:hypothetical protein